MDKQTFFSNLTSVLRADLDEELPEFENGIVFSAGLGTDAIIVTTTPDCYSQFLAAPVEDRAEIIQEVFNLYA